MADEFNSLETKHGNRCIFANRWHQRRIGRLCTPGLDRDRVGPLGRHAAEKQQRIYRRGHTAGHSEHRTLSLTKLADLAPPVLMQHCSTGKTIPKAKLEFMRADGDGKPVKYYQIELENVMISHMDQVMRDGGLVQDEIGLCFSKVKWTYTQQKISGGASGSTSGGWDLAAKKCA